MKYAWLEGEVRAVPQRTRETDGPERLQADRAERGVKASVHRLKRLRKPRGLRGQPKRKFKATTPSHHGLPVADHLRQQTFTATAPNPAWLSDITAIPTDEGWLYLAGHKDLFTGDWVG